METGLRCSSAPKRLWLKSYSLVLISVLILVFQASLLNGQSYYEAFESRRVNRSEAEIECTSQGGSLATFHREAEFQEIMMTLLNPQSHHWVDLKYNESSSDFEFSDGTSATFAKSVLPGASGRNNGKLCVVFKGYPSPTLKKRDCSKQEFYVCQFKNASSSTTAPQNISTAAVKEITGYMTVDDSGCISADGKIAVVKKSSWYHSVSVNLAGNSSLILIEANNTMQIGAILASFSNGIVTDRSWECISGYSKNETIWPKAISYGYNDATVNPWGKVLGRGIYNISSNAQWIWTSNYQEGNVVCRKLFGFARGNIILGFLTIDARGFVSADGTFVSGYEISTLQYSQIIFLHGDTQWLHIVGIPEVNNTGAMLASFSNGIVTDDSWECYDGFTQNETVVWPKAVSYGRNNGTANYARQQISSISKNAQWIWTKNLRDVLVECRKLFDPTEPAPLEETSFSIVRYSKEENLTIARERCADFDGHLYRVTQLNVSLRVENDINWIGILFSNSTFRWYNNETGAVHIMNCFTGDAQCSFLECFNKSSGVFPLYKCLVSPCPSCENIFLVFYICTKASTSSSILTAPSASETETLTETLMSSLPELTSTSSLTLSSLSASTSTSGSTSPSTSILSESLTLTRTSISISTSESSSASTLISTEIPTLVSYPLVALASESANSTEFLNSTSISTALVALASKSTTISSSESSSPSISNSTTIATTTSSLLVSPSMSQVNVQSTTVVPTESSTSQVKNSSISRVDRYERKLDAVDFNATDALPDIINITSELLETLSAENTTDRSKSSGQFTNIFEKRLIEYAEQRLYRHDEPVTVERKHFIVQMIKVSSTKSDHDQVFPKDENNQKADKPTSQDFIFIPREVFQKNSVFVGVLYFNLDIGIDEKSGSDFKDEQLNTNIISAEVSPKPKGILEKNISFTLSHRNSSGHGSNCVFIQNSEKNTQFSNVGCSILFTNDSLTTCTCNHMTSFAVLTRVKDSENSNSMSASHSKALSVITYVGVTLSLVGETLTVACYVLLIGLKTEQAHLHTNLAFSLGLAQIFFLIGIHSTGSKPFCVLMAALIHYFYLVTFSWMVVEGFHLYLMVVKVFNEESYLKKYYLFSWFAPLLIVTMVIIFAASSSEGVNSYISDNICWVSAENNFIWSFLGPVLLVCLTNLVLLFLVVKEMTKMNKSKDGPSLELRKSVKACLLLFPILGTTWLFCVLTMTRSSIAFEYIFNILNSFQGFLLFLFHVLRSSEIRAVFQRRRIQWSNSLDLTNNVSTIPMTTGNKSSVSANSIKPSIGNWVNRSENGSPDLFFSGSLSGRSSEDQVLPAVN